MTTLPTSRYQTIQRDLNDRFAQVRRRVRLGLWLRGLLCVVGIAVGMFVFALVADAALDLSRPLRVIMLLAGLGGLGYLTWRYLVQPLSVPLEPIELAAALDRAQNEKTSETLSLKQSSTDAAALDAEGSNTDSASDARHPAAALAPRVASIMQLPTLADQGGMSAAFIDRAVERAHAEIKGIDLPARVPGSSLSRPAMFLLGVLLIPILITAIFPSAVGIWFQRWPMFAETPWPRATSIELPQAQDGVIVVPMGERFELIAVTTTKPGRDAVESVRARLRIDGGKRENLYFDALASDTGVAFDNPSPIESAADDEAEPTSPTIARWMLPLTPLSAPATLQVEAVDSRLGPIKIIPVQRPRVTELTLESDHPWKDETEVFDFAVGAGRASVFEDAPARLQLTTNVPIASPEVRVRGRGGETNPNLVVKRLTPTTFEVTWTHERPLQLDIALTSSEVGALESLPYPVYIGMQTDAPPAATLQRRIVREYVTPNAQLPLTLLATDDWGLTDVHLAWERPAAAPGLNANAEATPEAEADHAPRDGRLRIFGSDFDEGDDPIANDDASENAARGANENSNATPDSALNAEDETETNPAADPNPDASNAIDESAPKRLESEELMDLQAIFTADQVLRPGERVIVRLNARDNRRGNHDDHVDGAQSAQSVSSAPLVFQIVAADELKRIIQAELAEMRSLFEAATNLADQLASDMTEADLSEAGRDASAESLLRSARLIRQQAAQSRAGLGRSAEEMLANRIGGRPAFDRMDRDILRPIDRLLNLDLSNQQRAIESLANDSNGLADTIRTQSEIVQSMRAILQAMDDWDRFLDVINQLDETIRIQEEALSDTESALEAQQESVFDD